MSERDPNWGWPFPARGRAKRTVMAKVRKLRRQAENNGYPKPGSSATPKMGFPGCVPEEVALEAHRIFAPLNFNNILIHTVPPCAPGMTTGEPQFEITNAIERAVMGWLADLCEGEESLKTVDGYITSGGTEGNIFGIVLGREYLRRNLELDNPVSQVPIAAIGSYETHYSVVKGLHIADIGEEPTADDEGMYKAGWHVVGVNAEGGVDRNQLEAKIRELYESGTRHFLLILTAGTCIGGGVDDIEDIASETGLLADLEEEFKSSKPYFFVHVDAAFGGFVLPFLKQPRRFGFGFKYVQTITLDPHKMSRMEYDCGAFLCRKGLTSLMKHKASYLPAEDQTLRGSRSGAIAVALWAVIQHLGREGYEKQVRECRARAECAQELLASVPGVAVIPSPMNFASFSIDRPSPKPIEMITDPFIWKYAMRWEPMPDDFIGQVGRHRLLVKMPIMPGTTVEHIETFVEELKVWLAVPVEESFRS